MFWRFFSRYQQKLQSDSCTIIDVVQFTERVNNKLQSLKETLLLGGWVRALVLRLDETDDELKLKGFTLYKTERRRNQHYMLVTDRRDITAVKTDIFDSLIEFLTERLSIDNKLLSKIRPFIALSNDADLSAVHELICSDLDLKQLGLEFCELVESDIIENFRTKTLDEVSQIAIFNFMKCCRRVGCLPILCLTDGFCSTVTCCHSHWQQQVLSKSGESNMLGQQLLQRNVRVCLPQSAVVFCNAYCSTCRLLLNKVFMQTCC